MDLKHFLIISKPWMELFSWIIILHNICLTFIFVWHNSHKNCQEINSSPVRYKGQLTCHNSFDIINYSLVTIFSSNQKHNWNLSHNIIFLFLLSSYILLRLKTKKYIELSNIGTKKPRKGKRGATKDQALIDLFSSVMEAKTMR